MRQVECQWRCPDIDIGTAHLPIILAISDSPISLRRRSVERSAAKDVWRTKSKAYTVFTIETTVTMLDLVEGKCT